MPTYFETELALQAAQIRQLRKQIAALVAALEGILDIDNPPWGNPGHVDFTTAIKMGRKALAQVSDE